MNVTSTSQSACPFTWEFYLPAHIYLKIYILDKQHKGVYMNGISYMQTHDMCICTHILYTGVRDS